jgi:hypothetical protein
MSLLIQKWSKKTYERERRYLSHYQNHKKPQIVPGALNACRDLILPFRGFWGKIKVRPCVTIADGFHHASDLVQLIR